MGDVVFNSGVSKKPPTAQIEMKKKPHSGADDRLGVVPQDRR